MARKSRLLVRFAGRCLLAINVWTSEKAGVAALMQQVRSEAAESVMLPASLVVRRSSTS